MQQNERILKERDEARNALESYVYRIRDDLEEDELKDFYLPEFKETFNQKLEDMEEWLYDEEGFNSSKSVYVKKLKELSDVGNEIKMRFNEFTNRPAALENLSKTIKTYREKSTTQDEAFSHWEDSDRKILVDACDKAEKWLNTVSESLQKTPKHVTPTTTVKMIQAAVSELHTSCLPVITKPKPKPKEPEKKEEAKKEEGEEGKKDEEGDKMDTEEAADGDGDKMDTTTEDDGKKDDESSEPMDTSK